MIQLRTQLTEVEPVEVDGNVSAGTVMLRARDSKNDGFKTPFSLANGPDATLILHVDNADAHDELKLGAEYIVSIETADAYGKRIAREQRAADAAKTPDPPKAPEGQSGK